MRSRFAGGYSTQTVLKYTDSTLPIYSISSKLIEVVRWEDGRPTEEIIGYKAMFIQEGLEEVLIVKFEKVVELPPFLAVVEFDNLMACEIRTKVYFKADGLKIKGGH